MNRKNMNRQKSYRKYLQPPQKKVFPFRRLTILLTQAKCATSEKLAFVYDTVKHGIQYLAIKRIGFIDLIL